MRDPAETRCRAPAPVERGQATARVSGLDTLRFCAACVVLMNHVGVPALFGWMSFRELPPALPGIVRDGFDGSAAVTVFFIISGFCIHYPVWREGARLQLVPFLLRRGLRILPPYLMAYALGRALGTGLGPTQGVFWSLICEMIYYALYPGLLALRRRAGSWRPLLGVAFVGAIGVALGIALRRPEQREIFESSVFLSALHGLPFWLLGCALAERFAGEPDATPPPSLARVILFRAGLLGAVGAMLGLKRSLQVGHIWTLLPFAVFAGHWLHVEIRRARLKPARWCESLGAWSYSLYVVHMPAFVLLADHVSWRPIVGRMGAVGWTLQMGGVLLLAWLFYRAIEAPSHALARRVARRFERPAWIQRGAPVEPDAR